MHGLGFLIGVLGKHLSVRLIDISASGCALASGSRIEEGTTGRLQLRIGGRRYAEDIRVTGCRPIDGTEALYRIGVEFLRTRVRSYSSLRMALKRMITAPTSEGRTKRNS